MSTIAQSNRLRAYLDPSPLLPEPAEVALADRLAWVADGGDPDQYPGPAWRGYHARGVGDRPPAARPGRVGRRPRPRPRRRRPGGQAGHSDSLILGVCTPGVYWLHAWTAAAWEAIAPGERPRNAVYSALLDAYLVPDLVIPWDDREFKA